MSKQRLDVPLSATRLSFPVGGGQTFDAIRLWVDLELASRVTGQVRLGCLLDTGAPISVVPYRQQLLNDLDWQPLPGAWPAQLLTWHGVPCTVGEIKAWAIDPQTNAPQGPYRLVAKFAQAHPPRIVGPVPVLLGLHFLADHQVETAFQCHTLPQAGHLHFP